MLIPFEKLLKRFKKELMLRIINTLSGLFLVLCITAQTNLLSPQEFLQSDYGKQFTPHHMLVDYFQHVAENSDKVKLIEYGRTNQDRPLILTFVSSKANLENLDDIRINNLKLAGIETGSPSNELSRSIVWLSYSVHGNEAGGSESSMQVIYDLVSGNNKDAEKWLENTVVIMDPCVNPDGYSRYTHWVRNVSGKKVNTDPVDIEHNEPWPGGRVNHYLHDLNRDWAWLTQVESRKRLQVYNKWLPHIHADLHEQGYNNPYYFAPAAAPYHKYITEWQRDFQDDIGRNHAKYFDREGWLYFTKERFDLFYPSYGDTYPMFSGSIGMTYEQAGHSRGGRGIETDANQILRLQDRIDHHKTTSLSTIEVASQHVDQIIVNFKKYFNDSKNKPVGKYKSYVLRSDGDVGKLAKLCKLLDQHDIKYGSLRSGKKVSGYSYVQGDETSFEAKPGDLVISAYQPKSVLLQVLFDPEAILEDSVTYDITSWALPYAYGFQGVATTQKITPEVPLILGMHVIPEAKIPYAYIFEWEPNSAGQAVGKLLQKDYVLRFSTEEFEFDFGKFGKGTIVINKADNLHKKDFASEVPALLKGQNISLRAIESGYTNKGPNFGSDKLRLIKKLNILTVRDGRVGVNAFGQVHYYFNEDLKYPITVINFEDLSNVDLDEFNLIVLPDGSYKINEKTMESIVSWIRDGGRLISIGGANNNFLDKEGFKLKRYATNDEKESAEKIKKENDLDSRDDPYAGAERRFVQNFVPGCVVKIKLDTSNPLAYGMDSHYFTLKTNSYTYPLLKDCWNVGHTGKNPKIYGFMGSNIKKRISETAVFAIEQKGSGAVIYLLDNVLFRSFWENGKDIFTNAIFFGGK
jgi:hypothetical protein